MPVLVHSLQLYSCIYPAAAMGRFPYQNIGIDAWSSMPIAVTPSLYVTDTLCVGHMYHIMALP